VLGAYRTAQAAITGATILDSTTWGLNTSTDYVDGVHFNTAGRDKAVAGSRGSVGL
jgi:hypothetical protein